MLLNKIPLPQWRTTAQSAHHFVAVELKSVAGAKYEFIWSGCVIDIRAGGHRAVEAGGFEQRHCMRMKGKHCREQATGHRPQATGQVSVERQPKWYQWCETPGWKEGSHGSEHYGTVECITVVNTAEPLTLFNYWATYRGELWRKRQPPCTMNRSERLWGPGFESGSRSFPNLTPDSLHLASCLSPLS